mgnify:CR=1 FL=1
MIEENAVKCIFFNHQYIGILDYLSYGNEINENALKQIDAEDISEHLDLAKK